MSTWTVNGMPVTRAEAETAGARAEHAALQSAAEEAQALCEAFDGQLRHASSDLTEREVYVCALLAELRVDDVTIAAASRAASSANAAAAAAAAAADAASVSSLSLTAVAQLAHTNGHGRSAPPPHASTPRPSGGGTLSGIPPPTPSSHLPHNLAHNAPQNNAPQRAGMHLGAAARARRDEATRRDSPAVGGGGGRARAGRGGGGGRARAG